MADELKVGDFVRFNNRNWLLGAVTNINFTNICSVLSFNGFVDTYPKDVLAKYSDVSVAEELNSIFNKLADN